MWLVEVEHDRKSKFAVDFKTEANEEVQNDRFSGRSQLELEELKRSHLDF